MIKIQPCPERRLGSNDAKRPTGNKAAVSWSHPDGIKTLGAGWPCSEWPSQPKKDQKLEKIFIQNW